MRYKFKSWHLAIFALSIYLLYLSNIWSAVPFLGAITGFETSVKGDIDGDGMVTVLDEELALNMAKGLIPADLSADTDEDGYIGPGDLSIITSEIKFNPITTNPFEGQDCILLGDLNRNGFIDIFDQYLTLQMMKGLIPVDLCADIGGDGFIGPNDLSISTALEKGLPAWGDNGTSFYQSIWDQYIPMECIAKGDINRDSIFDMEDLRIMRFELFNVIQDDLCGDITGDSLITIDDFYALTNLVNPVEEPECSEKGTIAVSGTCDLPGDFDKDGYLTPVDTDKMSTILVGISPADICADMNGDLLVGPADELILKKKVTGTESPVVPVCEDVCINKGSMTVSGECALPGDLNLDGYYGAADMTFMNEMIKGYIPAEACGDLDGDGLVNQGDNVLLLAKVKGLSAPEVNYCAVNVTPVSTQVSGGGGGGGGGSSISESCAAGEEYNQAEHKCVAKLLPPIEPVKKPIDWLLVAIAIAMPTILFRDDITAYAKRRL
jgi:hypothetical protein